MTTAAAKLSLVLPSLMLCAGMAPRAWAADFLWARQMGGASHDGVIGVAVDPSGNVYTVGFFSGTADFDPGPGTFDLTSAGDYDGFVSKLDSSGGFVWAKQLGGTFFDEAVGVALDADSNVYTVGFFSGTADFDPGPGTFNLVSGGSNDTFISKLDSAGSFVWAKQLGGGSSVEPDDVVVDASGNVYTVGRFSGTADFDPGPGTLNMTSAGSFDAFVSKLDGAGNLVRARQLGGAGFDEAGGVALDAGGNIYTVGWFQGTADFDPGPGTFNMTSAGFTDVFIARLGGGGGLVWAKQLGGASSEEALSVALDADGNVYTTGEFAGTADFDPGPGTFNLTPAGAYDAFISKLDGAGNLVWARRLGGTSDDAGTGVALDGSGNVYTSGAFGGTADFDPGPGMFDLTSAGSYDAFISKLDGAGGFVWAKRLGGNTQDQANDMALDESGDVYAAGWFTGTADFDPGPGTFFLTSEGGQGDAFISKLGFLSPGAAGAVADGDLVPGLPLTIAKAPGDELLLDWDPSCLAGDVDYEVYEGDLGTFTSHVPELCSTDRATSTIIASPSGSSYYVVVPTDGSVEGSHGRDSSGLERPPGGRPCLPQLVAGCP